MSGFYATSTGIWTEITTDPKNGSISRATGIEIEIQVVDETMVEGVPNGRDLDEGGGSVLIIDVDQAIKAGDGIQVTNVRGDSVSRPERIVKSVSVAGGFSASHLEVLI